MPKQITLPGTWNLDEQEREIALNESAGWELESLDKEDGTSDNRADFKRLPIGDQPNRVRLCLRNASPPANCKKLFDTNIFVETSAEDVTVYREK